MNGGRDRASRGGMPESMSRRHDRVWYVSPARFRIRRHEGAKRFEARPGPRSRLGSAQRALTPCGRTILGTGKMVGDEGTSVNVPFGATERTFKPFAVGGDVNDPP
jgi:hypothetical protein